MAGGYRPGSGRSKSGYYHGIYCGSTYELCWVIYSLDHQIEFTRFPGKLENDGIVYYPDFLLSDGKTIIETKGFEPEESVNAKSAVAEFFGYNVVVLRKNDLQYAFDYVKVKFNTNNFYELYDGYKPKYNYQCDFCGISFQCNKKKKTENKFCSRKCAGKGTRSYKSSSPHSQETKDKISKSLIGRKMKPYARTSKQQWITDGSINTKINSEAPIPSGFRRGRTNLKGK